MSRRWAAVLAAGLLALGAGACSGDDAGGGRSGDVPSGAVATVGEAEISEGELVLRQFVSDIDAGRFRLDCGERDLGRIGELLETFDDLRLGFADASVIACAERSGGRVLTFDDRDFVPVARTGAITLIPERAGR